MKLLTPLAAVLTCCTVLHAAAQELKPADLVAMKNYKVTTIDSLVQAKGFKKFSAKEETSFSIYMYLYQGSEGSTPKQRNLQVGLQKPVHVLSLEYGLWNKADAAKFVDQLTSDGFKKVGVAYKKGVDQFTYEESDQ